jgi:hypothetical protein
VSAWGAAKARRPQWLVASLRPDGSWDTWQGDAARKARERVEFVSKTLRGKYRAHIAASPEGQVTVYGPDGEPTRATSPGAMVQGKLLGMDPYNTGG